MSGQKITKNLKKTTLLIAALAVLAPAFSVVPSAQAAQKGASGLPLPRYVSLKSNRVNMRVGPGRQYKVDWMYTRSGLPLEILQEYDNWRKVRDPEGAEGWILHSLLSGDRTAIVAPWKRDEKDSLQTLREGPADTFAAVAKLEPGVVAKIDECVSGWCKMTVKGLKGYIEQSSLWGVYPDENIE